ncbi:hypothetical protein JADG_010219 [Aureobasidium aubasidani]|nr:hypothetical protein JADG_010219 [Aureobasidium pullulans]
MYIYPVPPLPPNQEIGSRDTSSVIGDPSRPVVGKQNTLFVLPAEVRKMIYGHALSTGSADVEDPEMNGPAVVFERDDDSDEDQEPPSYFEWRRRGGRQ